MADANAGRKAVLVLAANLAGAGLGYVALLLIGRYVAPAAYGSYLFALGLTGLFAVLSNLGLGQAHQRHVAQGVDPGRALGVLVRLRLAVAGGLVALFAGASLVWSAARGQAVTDATTPTVLVLAFAVHVLSGARQVLLDTWQGQQRVNRVEAVKFADSLLVVLLLANLALMLAHLQGRWEVVPRVGAYWAGRLGYAQAPGPEAAALLVAGCYATAKLATLALAWMLSWGDRLRPGGWDRELARSYARLALPLAASGALVLVLQHTDTLMLGYFWTAREVGLYGSAQKLATLALLAATAVATVLFPRFAQQHAAGDRAGAHATFVAAERWLLLLAAPLVAAMAALPRQGLHVAVGDAYLDAAPALALLALWAYVTVAAMPIGLRLMAEARTRLLVGTSALNAGLNVLLNLLLIPAWGLGLGPAGAALATLLSTTAFYAVLRGRVRAVHGLGWLDAHLVRATAAGAMAGLFWWAMPRVAGAAAFDRAWELAGWGLAGLAVYAAALVALGELRRDDLRYAKGIAHPRHLLAELLGR